MKHRRTRYAAGLCAAVSALIALAGCASGGTPGVPVAAGTTSAGQSEYRIGPGDTLEIFVWQHDDLSTNVPVRPDGKISTPLVEDMIAVGKTPTTLARDIETVLSEYIRSPQVNVIVQDAVGAMSDMIRVVGQAANPQSVSFRDRLTLLDLMIEVGGLGKFAAGNRSKIVRRTASGVREIPVRLHDLLNKGDLTQNVELVPGDVVVIPESLF
ncbi:MAG: XrtA/PEP-CTERM system exopolysaccharide export protein [Pseudomonadota bacterium]